MAKMPAASRAPKEAEDAATPDEGDGGEQEGVEPEEGDEAEGEDEGGEEGEEVLLTVTKHPDGTYCLYKGAEPEEGEEDEEGAGAEGENEQTFDSKGALLKGILDLLNEDEESEDEEGGSEDQFNAGFNEGKPASAVPQKY